MDCLQTLGENANKFSHHRNSIEILQRIENKVIMWSSSVSLGKHPQEVRLILRVCTPEEGIIRPLLCSANLSPRACL